MSKYRGVFISGTGGTGSTLMRRLFLSFRECKIIHQELRVDEFVEIIQRRRPAVTSIATRGGLSVFSHSLPPEEIERQLNVLGKNNVGILVMARDFEAASKSRSASITHNRWVAAYSQAFKYWKNVNYMCNYYRLVAEPDVVQKEIAKVFGLEIIHKFSDYPKFMPPEAFVEHKDNPQHQPRKIGAPYDKSGANK